MNGNPLLYCWTLTHIYRQKILLQIYLEQLPPPENK